MLVSGIPKLIIVMPFSTSPVRLPWLRAPVRPGWEALDGADAIKIGLEQRRLRCFLARLLSIDPECRTRRAAIQRLCHTLAGGQALQIQHGLQFRCLQGLLALPRRIAQLDQLLPHVIAAQICQHLAAGIGLPLGLRLLLLPVEVLVVVVEIRLRRRAQILNQSLRTREICLLEQFQFGQERLEFRAGVEIVLAQRRGPAHLGVRIEVRFDGSARSHHLVLQLVLNVDLALPADLAEEVLLPLTQSLGSVLLAFRPIGT